MDREEALNLLSERIEALRTQSYDALLHYLGNAECHEVVAPSGQSYQIEIEALWVDEPKADLQVMAAIDDGSLRWSLMPLNRAFIIRPDGSFTGE
jgi:hypothetical protein